MDHFVTSLGVQGELVKRRSANYAAGIPPHSLHSWPPTSPALQLSDMVRETSWQDSTRP
jgi:hypothetical protein